MPEYITKDQAIELLHYNSDEKCAAIIADVEELEPADVAPVVHARWVWHGIYGLFSSCSVCGTKFRDRPRVPYCPQCGARMDGEKR